MRPSANWRDDPAAGRSMNDSLRSILIGTAGLDLAFLAALALALRAPAGANVWRLRPPAIAVLVLQMLHFTEERGGGFAERFPETLGLAPWPGGFFEGFNIVWLCVWAWAIVAGGAGYPARAALWFLALSAIANGLAHPLLALSVGGYFPGLYTSPLLGLGGLWLALRLGRRSAAPGALKPPR